MSPVVLCEILALSVNTLTSDGKYPVEGCQNLQLQFKCNYLKNEKIFLHFFFHFWIVHQILNTLKEKIVVIPSVFPKLQTVRSFVRKLSRGPFQKRLWQPTCESVANAFLISMRALLSSFFIILSEVDLENVSLRFR